MGFGEGLRTFFLGGGGRGGGGGGELRVLRFRLSRIPVFMAVEFGVQGQRFQGKV